MNFPSDSFASRFSVSFSGNKRGRDLQCVAWALLRATPGGQRSLHVSAVTDSSGVSAHSLCDLLPGGP